MRTSDPDDIRPHDRRFAPGPWEKQVMRADWIDCDPVAMTVIEERTDIHDHVLTDRHGYPVS